MKKPEGREPRPAQLPATLADAEESEMMQYAREWLRAARGGGSDPFDGDVAHAVVQQMLKAVADGGERNAAFVVKMAAAEMEEAHEALAELISERNVRGEPLGPALATYVNMISHNGPAPVRLPEGRRRDSFVGDFVIVRLLIDLKAQFIGLKLRRSGSKRPSACSIVSAALIEMGLSRGSEEAIRKIWERYGPPTIPSYRRPPPPGVVRFTSRDM
jgi:hypothetical protein